MAPSLDPISPPPSSGWPPGSGRLPGPSGHQNELLGRPSAGFSAEKSTRVRCIPPSDWDAGPGAVIESRGLPQCTRRHTSAAATHPGPRADPRLTAMYWASGPVQLRGALRAGAKERGRVTGRRAQRPPPAPELHRTAGLESPFLVHCSDEALTLIAILVQLFEEVGVFKEFALDRRVLVRFILRIRGMYRNVFYHNFVHAFDVTHFLYLLMKAIEPLGHLDTLDKFTMLVAGIVHDVDHMGLNNRSATCIASGGCMVPCPY